MKKLFLIIVLFTVVLAKADTWTELSLEEATILKAYLTKNPFILDHCDCCNFEGEYASRTYLYKITYIEITTSEWGGDKYNLNTVVEEIAEIKRTNDGLLINNLIIGYNYESELTLSMNYTWGYNQVNNKVTPLYSIVPYDYDHYNPTKGYCSSFTDFPDPNLNDEITDKEYINWYNEHFNK